ncbi:MAG: F0F1 ATP synthase subunit delta [Magnetospirillum sp. WYHS-4]
MSTHSTDATGLAGRYASALFELAEADKALERVAEDLSRLDAMIRESADLARLIRSPVVARADQAKAMTALVRRIDAADLTHRFIGLVARNRRLSALPAMATAFQSLLAAKRGEVTAEVVSAGELSAAQVEALTVSLKKAVGSAVTVEARVDPSLIGGLVVKVGSRMVDSSLRSKLLQMRLAMKGVG